MLRGIGVGTKAIIILLVIGVLIAVWIIAGVVPYLISLGLELLNPRAFLPTACVICAVVSLATGSSWTTASTVGVSLMGVGNGLALQPAMVAGAIVSGAYFGDKMSPLSDSTNLAPAVTGVEIFDHIRHMVYTTAPAFAISLVLYSIIGYFSDQSDTSTGEVQHMQEALSSQFLLSPVLLLAPTVVIVLSVMRVTALPALVAAVGAAAILAISLQNVRVA